MAWELCNSHNRPGVGDNMRPDVRSSKAKFLSNKYGHSSAGTSAFATGGWCPEGDPTIARRPVSGTGEVASQYPSFLCKYCMCVCVGQAAFERPPARRFDCFNTEFEALGISGDPGDVDVLESRRDSASEPISVWLRVRYHKVPTCIDGLCIDASFGRGVAIRGAGGWSADTRPWVIGLAKAHRGKEDEDDGLEELAPFGGAGSPRSSNFGYNRDARSEKAGPDSSPEPPALVAPATRCATSGGPMPTAWPSGPAENMPAGECDACEDEHEGQEN